MSEGDDDRWARLPEHLRPLFGERSGEKALEAMSKLLGAEAEKLSTSRIGRAAKVSKLAVSAGSKMLWSRAKGALRRGEGEGAGPDVALAGEMLETFSQMRGITMKAGQMLSYIDDALPPEAQRVLALLQRDAPPMPFATVREVLARELGGEIAEHFESFDERPLAAASIGQVHRAVLKDGREVAVKIQYPGIDEAMRADLKNARLVGMLKGMLFFRVDAVSVIQELEDRFLDECDYTKEADYQDAYRARLVGHPYIVVPEVHRGLTTRRVLTTEFIRGRSFYEWLASDPSAEDRYHVTKLFYRFYIGSFYLDGLFNCDPHPGNYLFLPEGKVAFLDYGCSRRFPKERLRLWIDLCRSVYQDDRDKMHELAVTMGFVAPSTDYDKEAYRALMRYLYLPYLTDGPYHFASHGPQDTFRRMFSENPNLFKLNMPADAVFLNRIGFGLVSLMSRIGSSLDCRHYASQYFEGLDPDWPEDPRRGQSAAA